MRRRHVLLAAAALLPASLLPTLAAAAATLRTETSLSGPVVRVADLFDDAGASAARALGPAPAPGTRLVVEAAQLAAIARQFGVDWRPTSSGDRIVLERAGRVVTRAELLDPLRAALVGVGAPEDAEVSIPGLVAPMVAQNARPDVGVEQIDFDAGSSRFTATLVLTGTDVETQRVRVSGQVDEILDVPVPTHRIVAGTVITAADLRVMRLRASAARGEIVRHAEQAIGLAVKRAAFPGQPLSLAELTRPSDVHRGDRVHIELQAPGMSLAAIGVATEDGAIGERIVVLNPDTHAHVVAEIVAPGRVRVQPGAPPIARGPGYADLAAAR